MDLIENRFKAALLRGEQQLGLWCTLPGGYVAEALAGAGFEWLLFDTEHSPGDPLTVLDQLQAVAPYDVSAVVRPASNDAVLIKRFLDLGAQTMLIPFVQDASEAEAAVLATRYPPTGIRGVSALTRATRFGRISDYGARAAQELCVLVQIESVEALENLEAIAGVEGVDGVFIGPGDLAASMGFVGQPGHAAVRKLVEEAVARLARIQKPSGILTPDLQFARRCMGLGTRFTAVGVDVGVLTGGAEAIARDCRSAAGVDIAR